jgi:hypothetical protein
MLILLEFVACLKAERTTATNEVRRLSGCNDLDEFRKLSGFNDLRRFSETGCSELNELRRFSVSYESFSFDP